MVFTASEYQRAFMPRYEEYAKTYAANLGFRNVKRKTECSHDTNPFEWCPEIDETDEEVIAQKRPASVPLHIYKHALYNKAYIQRQSTDMKKSVLESELEKEKPAQTEEPDQKIPGQQVESDSNGKNDETVVSGKQTLSKGVTAEHDELSSVPLEELTKLRLNEESSDKRHQPQSDKAEEPPTDSHNRETKPRPKRPKKPVNRKTIPKAKPSTASVIKSNVSPRITSDTDKAPFAPYGYEDKEKETCLKMTHNIRASSQIYPAALKALHRRQCEVRERERRRKALSARIPKRNYFDIKMAKETADWETEYRHCYAAHDENVYRASLSARTLSKAATA